MGKATRALMCRLTRRSPGSIKARILALEQLNLSRVKGFSKYAGLLLNWKQLSKRPQEVKEATLGGPWEHFMPSRYPQQSFRFLLVVFVFFAFLSGTGTSTALAQGYVFGTGSFAEPGFQPEYAIAGDFNLDGKLDFAVTNQQSNSLSTVSILLGNPDGSFAPAVEYNLGANNPTSITVGDFNGDGNPDLVVGLGNQSYIAILLGKGDGTFQSPTSFQAPSAGLINGLTSGDFNHDGKADLAVSGFSSGGGLATILLGNGDGTFQPGITNSTAGSLAIITADFNNDGNLDLAVAGTSSSNAVVISVLLGNGDGTFGAYISVPVTSSIGVSIAAGDLNGDGKLDLVAATANSSQGGVCVVLGNGDGTFQAPVTYSASPGDSNTGHVAIGDFDGDGLLDVAAVNATGDDVSLFKGNGDGTLSGPVDYGAGLSPVGVIAGDFNSDGHLDIAAVSGYGSGYFTVLLGMGGGAFTTSKGYATAGTPAYGSLVGDFNGDGNLDLVGAGFASTGIVSVLLGKGDGTFQNHIDTAVGPYPTYMAAGDFNHDGKLDLVVSNDDATQTVDRLSILLGNGDGTFVDSNDIPIASLAGNIVVADFNNDRNLDFATVQQTTNAVSVFLGQGDGTFAGETQVPIPTNLSYGYVFTADFNKDGKADLATYINGGAISILLGNGDGSFQPAATVFPGDSLVAVGDFNGDGKADLVLYYGTTLYVALGNGDGTFQTPVTGALVPAVLQVVSPITGDFNGDRKLDLAFSGQAGTVLSVLLGNGDGTFGNRIDYLAESTAHDPVAGDFNGDGSLDIAQPTGTGFSVFLSSPIVALDPGMLSFADQPVGTTSAPQNVTLMNSSGSPLSIAGISASTNFAETNTCGASLAAMANCQVSVTFTPNSGGTLSGAVVLDDNAPGSPQAVKLYGAGSLPTAGVSPASLAFSSVDVGATSTAQTVTLKNTSSAVLTISSISTSGDFSQTNNCGSSLTGSASCTISVKFAPTTVGSRSGTLSVADNASSNLQTVALSGSGEDFTLSVASGSSSTASISAGGTASYSLTLAPEGGFNQTVSLACSGAPSKATCTVSPASATLDGTNSASVMVTVTTTAASTLYLPGDPAWPTGRWPGLILLGAIGLLITTLGCKVGARRKKLWPLRWAVFAGTVLLAVGLVACGGGSGGGGGGTSKTTPGTPSGTSTLTVTGTSGSLTHSQALTLTVK